MIAPAKTGRDNNNKIAVISTAQANRGIRSRIIPKVRKLPKVLIKFTAPKIDLTPAKCNEKIAKSTDLPVLARISAPFSLANHSNKDSDGLDFIKQKLAKQDLILP